MSFDPEKHTFVDYIPGSTQARIKAIHDLLISKAQTRIDTAGNDQRRVHGNTTYMHFGEPFGFVNTNGHHALNLRVAQKRSLINMIYLLSSEGQLNLDHKTFLALIDSLPGLIDLGYKFDLSLNFKVTQDIFPRGHTWHRLSYIAAEDYDPMEYGFRNDVSVRFAMLLTAPGQVKPDVMLLQKTLRARFDREPTLSTLHRSLNPEQGSRYPTSIDEPDMLSETTEAELQLFEQLVELAKDVRPVMDNPDRIASSLEFERQVWAEIFTIGKEPGFAEVKTAVSL